MEKAGAHPARSSPIYRVLIKHASYRAVMLQMKSLEINDNADHWKEKEHNALSDLIQRRISYLQVRFLSIQSINRSIKCLVNDNAKFMIILDELFHIPLKS